MTEKSPIEEFLTEPRDCVAYQSWCDPKNVRILRRLRDNPPEFGQRGSERKTERVVFVDCETTGTDPATAEAIQIGAITVDVETETGRIVAAPESMRLNAKREPERSKITPETTRIHGLTEQDVKGHRIDEETIERLLEGDPLMVAHNANFDRRMLEADYECFSRVRWACSLLDIDWAEECPGVAKNLSALLSALGAFHGAHGAYDDCMALLAVTAANAADGECRRMQQLLRAGREGTERVWITTGYDDRLAGKRRGARYVAQAPASAKWHFSGPNARKLAEEVSNEVGYDAVGPIERISPKDRFTDREYAI